MDGAIRVLRDAQVSSILIWVGLFFLLLGFFSKLRAVPKVLANQTGSALFIGTLLLTSGVIINVMPIFSTQTNSLSTSAPTRQISSTLQADSIPQVDSTPQAACEALFRVGNVLNWQITDRDDRGKLVNSGTIEIKSVNPIKRGWVGDQITTTKNNIRIRVTGGLKGSSMSLIHPSGAERWFGECQGERVEGSLKTTYPSRLDFEISKSN